jgi:hypothetical protein
MPGDPKRLADLTVFDGQKNASACPVQSVCEKPILATAGRPRSAFFQKKTGAFRPWLNQDHDFSHTLSLGHDRAEVK